MKREVNSLIKDLQDACRLTLYNGNEIASGINFSSSSSDGVFVNPPSSSMGDSSAAGAVPPSENWDTMRVNKRRRKFRTWEEVSLGFG